MLHPEDGGRLFLRKVLQPDYTGHIPECITLHSHRCKNPKLNKRRLILLQTIFSLTFSERCRLQSTSPVAVHCLRSAWKQLPERSFRVAVASLWFKMKLFFCRWNIKYPTAKIRRYRWLFQPCIYNLVTESPNMKYSERKRVFMLKHQLLSKISLFSKTFHELQVKCVFDFSFWRKRIINNNPRA
jgi:hypothetical protein